MHAGAGDFAGRAQMAESRRPVEVDGDPAARVVRGGHDRDGSGGQVEAVLQAAMGQSREPLADPLCRLVRDVEERVGLVPFEHALMDRARHHVAGGELGVRMHLVEKRVPGGVRDPGTLAAQGLGQQEAPLRMDERGRMELDELEVQEPRAGAPRHRDAVSPGALRVGRVEIDLSEAAGREDRLAREKRPHLAGLALEQLGSHDGRRVVPIGRIERVVGERQKVDRCGPNEPPHVLLPSARVDESAFDRRSRFVLDVQDPRHRVGSLERPVEVGALPVERHPELVDQEVAHEVGPFARQQADRFGVAQPVARADDVGGEQLGRVAGRPRDRVATVTSAPSRAAARAAAQPATPVPITRTSVAVFTGFPSPRPGTRSRARCPRPPRNG